MLALNGAWKLLRALGEHAARGLAVVESLGVHDRARHNAATAAALASAHRREGEDVERLLAVYRAAEARTAAVGTRRAHG